MNKSLTIETLLTTTACLCLATTSAEALPLCADSTKTNKLQQVEIRQDTRKATLLSAAPKQKFSVDEMASFGSDNLSDAIKHMAGVTLRDYGGAGGMKTASIRGLGAQFTAVSYDGVAISDVQTGQIDLQRYTLSGIKSVSLQIGDGTDIFVAARNSVLPSLLDIETLSYTDKQSHVTAQTTVGAWGYVSPALTVYKPIGKLSLSAIADYVYAENNYPFTIYNISERVHKHRTHSLMNQGHAELTASYQFNERHFLSMKTYYYDNDRQLPGIVRFYTSESKQNLRERNTFTQLRYNGRLSDSWQLKGVAKWNWASSDYRDKLYQDGIMDAQYWQREGYLSTAVLWKPLKDLSASYATDYICNSLNSQSATIVNRRPTRQSILNTLALRWNRHFLTATARVLRSDYLCHTKTGESGRNYHRWTPSAAIALRPSHNISIRLLWKKIFRMPSFSELYYYHLGTKDLRPEQTSQWNLGITTQQRITNKSNLSLSLDGYYNKVTDKIVSIPVNLFVWQNINASRVDVTGLDLAATYNYTINSRHSLKLQGHYSYQHAVDKSAKSSPSYDKQIAYMPNHTFSMVATWTSPWLNISIDSNGQSGRWATNAHNADTHISGYAEFGITAFRTISFARSQSLKLSLTLSNILNKQYEIVAHYPMPGRGWRANLSYAF